MSITKVRILTVMRSHFSKLPRRPRRGLDAHLDTRYVINTVTYRILDALDAKNIQYLKYESKLFLLYMVYICVQMASSVSRYWITPCILTSNT